LNELKDLTTTIIEGENKDPFYATHASYENYNEGDIGGFFFLSEKYTKYYKLC